MTFDEVLNQVRELLQQRGRVTYRSLKRRFDLNDDYLEDLKGELIRAEGVATDEDGDVLVWTGKMTVVGSSQSPAPQNRDAGLRTPDWASVSLPRSRYTSASCVRSPVFSTSVNASASAESPSSTCPAFSHASANKASA